MTNANDPIPRRKLSDAVRERLIRTIHAEGMTPGDILPSERELMELYGVGRPAIREAMQTLAGQGLIEVRHGGRPRVAQATFGDALDQMGLTMRHVLAHSAPTLEQLKDVRLATETHLAERAAGARSDEDLAQMRSTIEAQARAESDSEQFIKLDGAFHEAVAHAAGNPIFTTVVRAVFSWLEDFHVSAVRVPGREQLTIEEHTAILDAIESRDGDAARRAMAIHLNRANALYSSANRRHDT